MQIDFTVIIFYALAIIIIYLVGFLIARPLKWMGKTLLWALPGGIALILVNLIGAPFGLGVAINPVTAVTAAFLGVPGVAMMILLEVIM
jgi:inhibitor of the pro-sigma K processing machinery